jgi:hypothetical protein
MNGLLLHSSIYIDLIVKILEMIISKGKNLTFPLNFFFEITNND